MSLQTPPAAVLRFGTFEVDVRAGELRKQGVRLKLQEQPFQVLIVLLQRPGEVVTREELRSQNWPPDTFVDFDNSLNTAINKLREALGDSADNPRFVETLPRRGYRFIAPVTGLDGKESAERLDSWKEIAAYLKRDERTVRRWESEGLPVHRKIHKKQASVFAFPAEIDAWWNSGRERLEAESPPKEEIAAAEPGRTWRRKSVWILALGGAVILASVFAFNVAGIRNRIFAVGVPPVHSIAVLPLENLSRDPEQEYFADGITEQLTTELAQISSLKVISHTSVVQYKGTTKLLPQIAKELGVDAVVEGAVQRSGEKVGINVQLVQAPTDRHLWAKSYERDLRDVLDLEREVTHAIADEIKAKVTATEEARLTGARAINRAAYEDYLKGWYFFDKRTPQAAMLSVGYFRKSLEQDPRFPSAYVGLAEALETLSAMDVTPYSETQAEASQALRHALELDPKLGEAHAALGLYEALWNWNWVAAERQLKMGLQLSPGSAIVHNRYSRYLQAVGRLDEGVQEARRAAELDPLSFFMHRELGRSLYFAREYDEAIAELGRAAELDPHASVVNNWLSWIAEKRGDHQRAMELWLLNAPLSGVPENATVTFRKAYEDRDWKRFCEADLRFLTEARNLPSAPYFIAVDQVRLGNKDAAFEWLGRSLEDKNVWVTWIKVDPLLDDLHADPRFKDLLRRVGLPQ